MTVAVRTDLAASEVRELAKAAVTPEQARRLLAIALVLEEEQLRIEVRGDLAAILALGQSNSTQPGGRVHEDLLVQVKLVAGARNHRELPLLSAPV